MNKTLKDLTGEDIDLLMQVHRALVTQGYEETFANFLEAVIGKSNTRPLKIEVISQDAQRAAKDWLLGGRYVQ